MIRQAIISAGGLGTRLRPYTNTMPKPMLPVLGKPMLEWHVEQFRKFGVTEFFFTLHHLPQVITHHFGDGSTFGVKIHYFVEERALGSAGGIKKFEPSLGEEFFYIYGDTFSLMDYGKMEESWRRKMAGPSGKDAVGMQRVARTDDHADADVAELDAAGRFVAIHGKPHVRSYPNAYRLRGAFILRKKILSHIPGGDVPFDLGKQLLPAVIAAGEDFYGYECDDYSKGIDTVEKWKEVEEHVKKGRP
jgi:NDP-sugar pyrophosphorylase family protein